MSNSYNMKDCGSTAAIAQNGVYPSTYCITTNINEKHLEIPEYDPFKHRKLQHPNSDLGSFANLLKSSLGSGILAMPYAFQNAGTVVGIVGTIILGYICTHCVYLLVKTSQNVSKVAQVPSLGYAETVEAVFATGPQRLRKYSKAARKFRSRLSRMACFRIFIDWAMALTILGACVAYVILLARSLEQIVKHFFEKFDIGVAMYCLMFLLPLLLITQIKNLKYLAPFSAIANMLLVLTFMICLYFIISQFPPLDSVPQSVDIGKLPLFIGTVIFAMEGIGVVLPVENAMSKPQHFLGCPGVLNITMSVVVVLYMSMGFLGYVRYGDAAEGSITLNLDSSNGFAIAAQISIIFAIFFTYSLQYYVPMEIVWRNIKSHFSQKYHNSVQSVMRAVFATLTVALAALFPELEKVIGLEGAIFYSFLGLVVPTVIEIIFLWERGLGKFYWIFVKDLMLGIFGMFVLVTGSTQSLRQILKDS